MRTRQRTQSYKRQSGTGAYPGNPTAKPPRYPNGDVWCQRHSDRIDHAVCIARAVRQPEKCKGCPLNL
ncbi:MAG: hypothetical protein GXX82_05980 [Syntrophorhabdus sp.]|nr:hypothetical protein [Syntrophorhabdus sp.]